MSLKPLTDLMVQKLPTPPKGQKVYYEPSGLGVRISQGGTKSFVVQIGPSRRRRTLGRYPQMSLKEARSEACKLIADHDPHSPDRTAESLIEEFLAQSAQRNKPRTVRDYSRILNKHFPDGIIQDLGRPRLQRKLQSLSATPAEQHHTSVIFQTFLNWCVNCGHIHTNPLQGIKNPGKVNQRERVLSDEELRAVWSALPSDRFGSLVRLMILTGQRKSEVSHLVLEQMQFTLPAEWAKNGRSHSFPIGELTLRNYVATSWNGWSKSKARLDKASGVTGWTFHDLRRTFASNHARLGTPIHVIEKMLNHVSGSISGVAAIYNRYNYMPEMVEATQRYEDWFESTIATAEI